MVMKGGKPENLKPRKKGQGPLPGAGRPKGSISLTDTLKQILDDEYTLKNPFTKDKKSETKSVKHWLNLALIARAMKGNIPAINTIYERIEGKVAQQLKGDLNVNVKELTTEQLEEIIND